MYICICYTRRETEREREREIFMCNVMIFLAMVLAWGMCCFLVETVSRVYLNEYIYIYYTKRERERETEIDVMC